MWTISGFRTGSPCRLNCSAFRRYPIAVPRIAHASNAAIGHLAGKQSNQEQLRARAAPRRTAPPRRHAHRSADLMLTLAWPAQVRTFSPACGRRSVRADERIATGAGWYVGSQVPSILRRSPHRSIFLRRVLVQELAANRLRVGQAELQPGFTPSPKAQREAS